MIPIHNGNLKSHVLTWAIYQWLDSNHLYLVSEVTSLPTAPQILPNWPFYLVVFHRWDILCLFFCSSFQHSLQLKNVSWKFTYLQSCNYKCKVFIRLAKNTTWHFCCCKNAMNAVMLTQNSLRCESSCIRRSSIE